MNRAPALLLVVVAISLSGTATADTPRAEKQPGEPSDIQDLIFLAPEHPLFIRLHIHVDGKSYRDLPHVLAANLFQALDIDGDGTLNQKEAKRIPPRNRFRSASQATPISFRELDIDENNAVTPEELQAFVLQSVGNPLTVERQPPRRTVDVDLFSQFDHNDDGVLTPQEIQQTRALLAKQDIDDDETYSVAELEPLMPRAGTDSARGSRGTLLIALDNTRWQSDVAFKLLKFYGDKTPTTGKRSPRKLNRSELGIEKPLFKKLDTDGDGWLTMAELTPLVQEPVPQMELLVQLRTKGRRRLKIKVISQPKNVTVKPGRSGRMTVTVSGIEILLSTSRIVATAYDDRQLFKVRFIQSDSDKNQYLNNTEFAGLQLPGAQFSDVDRDGDEMVTVGEVTAYVKQQSSLTRNQAKLEVAKDGKSLFEMLDENIDRRLSPREFQTALVQLRDWDANGDGHLALTEIPNKYKLTFAVGRSLLFSTAGQRNVNMTAQRPAANTAAPVWFQKMDRNRDGDVSKREFLGTLDVFQKIDTDDDDLISVEEADAVK